MLLGLFNNTAVIHNELLFGVLKCPSMSSDGS